MDLWEFLTYAESYFLKILVATAVPFIILAIKQALASATRGIIDSQMAGLANSFSITCPKCKIIEGWDPVPDSE